MPATRSLSPQAARLFAALAESEGAWVHGYDLCKATGLKSGTLYPLLVRLADRGLVEAEWRASPLPGRPSRHVYRLTAQGRALARAMAAEGAPRAASPRPATA